MSRSEYDILLDLTEIGSSLQLYCRLVEDISVILQSKFSTVRQVLNLMALHYPNMPLNVQISFGYSRFLDLHLYNISASDNENETYGLCRVLAYKEISSFSQNFITKYSSLAARKFVIAITFAAASNGDFIKMTFPFQCFTAVQYILVLHTALQ